MDFVFWYTGLFGPPYRDEYKSHPQGLKVTVVENLTPQGDKSYDEIPLGISVTLNSFNQVLWISY